MTNDDRIAKLIDATRDQCSADLAHEREAQGGPPTVSVTEAAVMLGYTEAHIRNLAQAGRLHRIAGRVTAESIGAFVASRADDSRYRQAQVALVAERARISELKRRVMERELVKVASVVETFSNIAAVIRNRILRVPAEVADPLAGITVPARAEALMTEHLEAALHELAALPVEGPGKTT